MRVYAGEFLKNGSISDAVQIADLPRQKIRPAWASVCAHKDTGEGESEGKAELHTQELLRHLLSGGEDAVVGKVPGETNGNIIQ